MVNNSGDKMNEEAKKEFDKHFDLLLGKLLKKTK